MYRDNPCWMCLPTVGTPYLGVNFIHPLKQKKIKELREYTQQHYPCVQSLIVFGSSTQDSCHPGSDIDIVVCGDRNCEFSPPDNDEYDVLFAERINEESDLWKEIREEGVIVYDKNLS